MSSKKSPFRSFTPRVEQLECRITPVLANNALAPLVPAGAGFDGVVLITTTIGAESFTGTGFLLPGGRHILTAAHNFTTAGTGNIGITAPARVSFDMPTAGRIDIEVPIASIVLNPGYTGQPENDLAVMTLPVLAPSGAVGTLGAERYSIYRATDEVGQVVTIVGYGTIGTGTTGQQNNADLTKRMTRNRYDSLGDRVNYGGTQALLYDFDNGIAANDAFGRLLGINDLGLPDEGTSGQGDSGGPAFFQVNGQFVVAGTTTSGPGANGPLNPAVVNPLVQAGFGSLSHDTRMSFHAAFIDAQSVSPAAQVLDLRFQVVGRDAVADAISVRVVGVNLELVVNGQVYQSFPVAGVTSLALIGTGDGMPFDTTATIENTVPLQFAITYQRILTVTDNRDNTMANPPAGAPPISPAPPGTPRGSPRLALPLNLESFPNALSPSDFVAVGTGSGAGSLVTVHNAATGAVVRTITPFAPEFLGGVRTAIGDLTGDFVDDVIVAAGAGGGSHVKVFDGATGAEIRSFFAFAGFDGAIFVAAGDVNGDGVDDMVVSAGAGGGPHVKVFDGVTGAEIQSFFAYDAGFSGGVTVAVGDVNDDGFADIITGAGAGGGPHVKVFDGLTGAEIRSFFAFDFAFQGGVYVAAGDVNNDGAMDIVVGAGTTAAHVKVFDARTTAERLSFFSVAGPTDGIRVAVADADGDGLSDVITASGAGSASAVRVFEGEAGSRLGGFLPFEPSFLGGVFVGGRG